MTRKRTTTSTPADDLKDKYAEMRRSLADSFKRIGIDSTASAAGMHPTDLRAIQEGSKEPTELEVARINKVLNEHLSFAK